MSTKRAQGQISVESAFTAQIPPLNRGDMVLVRQAMAEFAPECSVELQGICAEEATLVVLPEDGDDAMGPSFMISRESYGLRVDQVHWDVLTEVGVFASLTDVVAAMRARLAFGGGATAPASITLH